MLYICILIGYFLGFSVREETRTSILLGGKNAYEGNIYAVGEDLVFGPVCDEGFGFQEVF